jgi:hypothetical protein
MLGYYGKGIKTYSIAPGLPLNSITFLKPKVLVFLAQPRPDWGY